MRDSLDRKLLRSPTRVVYDTVFRESNYLWTASLKSVKSRLILQKPGSGFPIELSPELNPILNPPPK